MAKDEYAIIILAAGSSTRLGFPKQLVHWKESTLLNHTIQQASLAKKSTVFVALGGNKEGILPTLPSHVTPLILQNWKAGMGASIAESLQLIQASDYQAIIISVCDQPFISQTIYESLIDTFESSEATIVLSKYKEGAGPPSLFSYSHFTELMTLSGDHGARSVVAKNMDHARSIAFPKGYIDIDNKSDLDLLNS